MDSPALNTQVMIDAVAERAGSEDPLALLEAAIGYAALLGSAADAMVDHYVQAARTAGLSWTDIGDRLGISKQAARQRFAPRLQVSGGPAAEPVPVAPRLAACVAAAQAAADAEGGVPGSQHLLLGLMEVGVAAGVLDRLGVTRERIRESAARLLESRGDGEAYDHVLRARRFAASRGQNLARTEHLLWTLTMDPGSSARRILDDLGVAPARMKKELNDLIPPPPRPGRRGRKPGRRDTLACSFCGCADGSRAMVNGPGVQICGECVALAVEIIEAAHGKTTASGRRLIP
ncbi:Clp protease N-terminal domain-containing protein [Nonomuraea typhae]|uniref:Clp protease N-terminal domain-containing protein n=1 Tax=Nonomuraea typhae TaxID=2603600 RepID=UPI0012F72408|nr:ClpX C4-type zinc finger protein [Nonomuraea typhae]